MIRKKIDIYTSEKNLEVSDIGFTAYAKKFTRMPIYANYSAIFRQRECENQFSQRIPKSGRILRKKPRNVLKLVSTSLQIEN